MKTPLLAAITLDASGGGVAVVARLAWQVLRDCWGEAARLVELLPPASHVPHASTLRRVRFGVDLLREQLVTDPWIFFAHVALVKALAPVPRARRPPYVVFLHGVEAWRPLRAAELGLLEDAALIVSNSEFTRAATLASNPGLPPIAVCPLALEPSFSASVPAPDALELARSTEPPTVLIVGRLAASERYKGHDQLLEAWPSVRRQVPAARLIVVGEGDDRTRLAEKASALGLGDAVRFTGFVTPAERARWYERAQVFALPSRGEGFGLVYLEAMAYGLPCIGSTEDAAREVIHDGVTGWLVPQDDRADLAARIVHLLGDRDRALRMGAAGRQRVATDFSYRRFRDRLHHLITESLEGRTPGRRARGIA